MTRLIGWVVMFAGSEAIGIAFGQAFYRLFVQAMPPMAMSSVNQGASHAVFLLGGAIAGGAIFAWSLLVASIAGAVAARRATRAAEAQAAAMVAAAAPPAPPPATPNPPAR
jgi:hypothetical protein